ncbi:hypothetical protein D4R71_01045 [bacterium]|nr:MAG: hypothetical protein D4R71_01045 [bacterium]
MQNTKTLMNIMENQKDADVQKQIAIMRQLRKALTFINISLILIMGYSIIDFIIITSILAVIAISFTPYLITSLIKLKKWYWIIGCILLVGIPLILGFTVSYESSLRSLFFLISLFMFYFFCWILRSNISGWIKDISLSPRS